MSVFLLGLAGLHLGARSLGVPRFVPPLAHFLCFSLLPRRTRWVPPAGLPSLHVAELTLTGCRLQSFTVSSVGLDWG